MRTYQVRRWLSLTSIAVTLALGGCATTADNPKDPYEGFNRAMFQVNEGIDVVLKPVAEGYDAAAPLPVKAGVGNFFGNLADFWIAINGFLQGKGGQGASDIGRVLVNSTLGIGGLFDIASEIGMDKHDADFGQTLGKWGVAEGPFFYWPLVGPRTTRDTFGWMADAWADPVPAIEDVPMRNTLYGVRIIHTRARLLPADKLVEQAAFDKYNYIRDAYLQNRRSFIEE